MFHKFGTGTIENSQLREFASNKSNTLVNFFKKPFKRNSANENTGKLPARDTNLDQLTFGKEKARLNYNYAICCSPIPGYYFFGFLTIN